MNEDPKVVVEAESEQERARQERVAREQGVFTIGEQVAQATGVTVVLENTGGDVMVATIDRTDGALIALTPEGAALFEGRGAWEDSGEPVATEGGDPEAVVATATRWLTQSA